MDTGIDARVVGRGAGLEGLTIIGLNLRHQLIDLVYSAPRLRAGILAHTLDGGGRTPDGLRYIRRAGNHRLARSLAGGSLRPRRDALKEVVQCVRDAGGAGHIHDRLERSQAAHQLLLLA